MQRIRAALLGGVCLLSAAMAQDLREETVRRLCAELSQLGFPVHADSFRVEVRERTTCYQDMDRQQDIFFSRGYFDVLHALRRAFGLPAGTDPVDLRRLAVQGYLTALRAYYQPDRRTLVFLESFLDQLTNFEHLLLHELVHAYQDMELGLFDRLAEHDLDGVRARQCLLEGSAEILAMAVLAERNGVDLSAIDPEELDDSLDRLLVGEAMSLPYTVGRAFMLRRLREGGIDSIRQSLLEDPISTEQVLHPQKLGADLPREVELSALELAGSEAVGLEVVGELEIRKLLLELEDPDAYRIAAGWDGDRLAVFRNQDESWSLVWRSLWDREEDARQFADALEARVDGEVVRDGLLVDWILVEDGAVRDSALAFLALERPDLSEDSLDAATTAAVERAWVEKQTRKARVEQARWVLPEMGVSLPIPAGWRADELNGVAFLVREESGPFRDNITAIRLPCQWRSLEELKRENQAFFEQAPGLVTDRIEILEIAGTQVLLLEYHGILQPGAPVLHFLSILLLREGEQVVLTATARERAWEMVKEDVEASLFGLELDAEDP